MSPEEDRTRNTVDSEPKHYQLSYSGPHLRHEKQTLPVKHSACLLAGCLTSQQYASVSQGRSFSDKRAYCHTEIEVTGQHFYLTKSQYTDTRLTSPSADPITPGIWRISHWSISYIVTGMTQCGNRSMAQTGIEPRSATLEADTLTQWHSVSLEATAYANLTRTVEGK